MNMICRNLKLHNIYTVIVTDLTDNIFPYPRVILGIKSGTIDFAIMFDSPEANKIGVYVGKIADHKIFLNGRAGTPNVKSLDQLGSKLVALPVSR